MTVYAPVTLQLGRPADSKGEHVSAAVGQHTLTQLSARPQDVRVFPALGNKSLAQEQMYVRRTAQVGQRHEVLHGHKEGETDGCFTQVFSYMANLNLLNHSTLFSSNIKSFTL